MPVYFCNEAPIDLNAIAIMGVSVKDGDTPIGYFGTGLKFSIATLLRTGHKVELIRDGGTIPFSVSTQNFRGEDFERVTMGDEPLGFTTKLGRNWEPWQAYRELYCNCLDEQGVISDELPVGQWGTIFIVTGEAVSQCHRNRHEIFLSSNALSVHAECEIHEGETHSAFYRGVRAHDHQSHALFTYNITDSLELTEDRTVKNGFMVGYHVQRALAACDDECVIERALMAPEGTFEQRLSYSHADKPSLAFMDVAFRLRRNLHCNQGAIKLWEKHADVRLTYTKVTLDAFEEELLDQAIRLVSRLGADIERRDFLVVDGMGEGLFGAVRGGQILISRRTFDMGHRFLASTLYEEWLHKNEGLRDESRDLQNLLFEKLFAMVERVSVMERHQSFKEAS